MKERPYLEKLLDFFDSLDEAEATGSAVAEAHWADRRSLVGYIGCLAQVELINSTGLRGVLDELLDNADTAAKRAPTGQRAVDECAELASRLLVLKKL
mmetsp:Transcript_38958/g.91500  ORF Transcript_38958/g.91500 Transcript_38958/m.91500 type:complete len:98 (+) Transcript_38958:373-666(+)